MKQIQRNRRLKQLDQMDKGICLNTIIYIYKNIFVCVCVRVKKWLIGIIIERLTGFFLKNEFFMPKI